MEPDAGGERWTEEVDDLVDAGDVDAAISLLESVVSKLSTSSSPSPAPAAGGGGGDLRLAAALGDLAGLHASRGHTLRADELRAQAIALRSAAARSGNIGALTQHPPPPALLSLPPPLLSQPAQDRVDQRLQLALPRLQVPAAPSRGTSMVEKSPPQEDIGSLNDSAVSTSLHKDDGDEDDWEALADRGVPDETLIHLQQEVRVASTSSSENSSSSSAGPKRRGRGSFLYNKSVLYSDQCELEGELNDEESGLDTTLEDRECKLEDRVGAAATRFGTKHVLVLYDFSTSTRTVDLERIFEDFRDRGVAIRWVNDTTALAVFRTPSAAHEAQACIPSRYKVRLLKEDDDLLTKMDIRELEPPIPRPKTSARTAQRLIAHGMGLKQFSNFSSEELKKQEEARKNRIISRQALRDDAWGSD